MELRQLEYFAAVARHGNFTRAAAELWITQPALSQQVRRLEGEVGVELLRRTSRGAEPTAAGAALLVHAEAILASVAAARAELDRHAGAEWGLLRIVTTTTDAPGLPPALAAFHRRHPAIQIALRQASADEAVALVQRRAADLAVVSLRGPVPADVRAEVFEDQPMRVMVAADDSLAAAERVSLTALASRPFVLAEAGTAARDAVVTACQAVGFSPVPLFEVGDPATARGLVAAGLAVSVVPASWLDAPGAPVAGVALAEPAPRHRVTLVSPPAGGSPAGGLLLAALCERG